MQFIPIHAEKRTWGQTKVINISVSWNDLQSERFMRNCVLITTAGIH